MTHLTALLLAYILNSLWQIPIFFAGATLTTLALRRHNPRIVHRIWVAALLLEAIFPALCLRSWPWLDTLSRLAFHPHHTQQTTITFAFGPASTLGAGLASPFKTTLITVYLAASAYFVLKLLWSLHKTSALRTSASDLTPTPTVQATWRRCCRRFSVQHAILAESTRIHAPLTLGLRRKHVLVPPGLLATLPEPDLHALLAHECAHMQRNDFARNLFYEFLTLSVAYHPLLWTTRARMVESREWICDTLAADAISARHTYARSLLRLAELLLRATPATPSHGIGIFDAHVLERRLMHLTQKPHPLTNTRRATTLAASMLIAVGTCGSAWALRASLLTPAPQSAPAPSGAVRIAPGVMAGQVVTRVNPVYPQEAKEARIQGSVVLHAIISREGTVEQLTVVSGPDELQASAIDAVRQWTYKPYLLNGEPTIVETTITVNFQLTY